MMDWSFSLRFVAFRGNYEGAISDLWGHFVPPPKQGSSEARRSALFPEWSTSKNSNLRIYGFSKV